MIDINKVLIAGRLTRDPEVKTVRETTLARLSVAYSSIPRKGAEKETTFLDVTAFGKSAEFAEKWLAKGNAVFVEGRLKQENWQDKDGNKRSKIVLMADRLSFGESKGEAEARGGGEREERPADPRSERKPAAAPRDGPQTEDDLPF